MSIRRPAGDVFEAFVDPEKIGGFWFSSSSERWEQGRTVILRYEEYDAEGEIEIVELIPGRKIAFHWGSGDERHLVTITLNDREDESTVVEVNEEGFREDDAGLIPKLVGNKEGWVYMLTCLKAYLECGVTTLRAGLVHG
ncbi:SRPBCC family protein [Paenibacillus humicola]|uniref:SRPBCC family protein n=1 Tax=Paenibacillus humicola TaxID=3110540 RepID=UPI0030842575